MTPAETRILDATKICCERHGIAKVSIDDIAAEAGVSRATLYRMYPGGKDVVFDALRVRELEDFFDHLKVAVIGSTSLEDLLVGTVVAATNELRSDQHLAIMLMSEPGETLAQLTVGGVPRIIRMATLFLSPMVDTYLDRPRALRVVDVLARLVISYFLAPSDDIDLGDEDSARFFIRTHVLPTFQPAPTSTPTPTPNTTTSTTGAC